MTGFTSTIFWAAFYKMFMDNADFKRQYLEFVFERLWGRVGVGR